MFTSKKAQYVNKDFINISPITSIDSLYYEQAIYDDSTNTYNIVRNSFPKHMPIKFDVSSMDVSTVVITDTTYIYNSNTYSTRYRKNQNNIIFTTNFTKKYVNDAIKYESSLYTIDTNTCINFDTSVLNHYNNIKSFDTSLNELKPKVDYINQSVLDFINHQYTEFDGSIYFYEQLKTLEEKNLLTPNKIYNLLYYPTNDSLINKEYYPYPLCIKMQCISSNNAQKLICLGEAMPYILNNQLNNNIFAGFKNVLDLDIRFNDESDNKLYPLLIGKTTDSSYIAYDNTYGLIIIRNDFSVYGANNRLEQYNNLIDDSAITIDTIIDTSLCNTKLEDISIIHNDDTNSFTSFLTAYKPFYNYNFNNNTYQTISQKINSNAWEIQYDLSTNTITYLKDEFNNEGYFDFRNKIIKYNNIDYHICNITVDNWVADLFLYTNRKVCYNNKFYYDKNNIVLFKNNNPFIIQPISNNYIYNSNNIIINADLNNKSNNNVIKNSNNITIQGNDNYIINTVDGVLNVNSNGNIIINNSGHNIRILNNKNEYTNNYILNCNDIRCFLNKNNIIMCDTSNNNVDFPHIYLSHNKMFFDNAVNIMHQQISSNFSAENSVIFGTDISVYAKTLNTFK